jgi:predicted GNAT family N-acyltransferase
MFMEITIESVVNEQDLAALQQVREQVFTHEMGIKLPHLMASQSDIFHLLARRDPDGEVIATMSVVETSGDEELHHRYNLPFQPGARVARYTQLAVLRHCRGMHIPLKLILEAHRRFVAPNYFDYTWLLFDAERASSSHLHRWLAFDLGTQVYLTEYGMSRTLVRYECTMQAHAAIRRARELVDRVSTIYNNVSADNVELDDLHSKEVKLLNV